MKISRRDLLKGHFQFGRAADKSAAVWPDGVNILLDRDRCTAWGKGLCTACETACPERALFFVGMMNPKVLTERCTFCGECVPVCPTQAIRLRRPNQRKATTP